MTSFVIIIVRKIWHFKKFIEFYDLFSAFNPIAIEKYQSLLSLIAEVSKPGQPRRTQDPQK